MTIDEFEEAVCNSVPKDDESHLFEKTLRLELCMDGCLAAMYDGRDIPCEGHFWRDSLTIIAEFIRERETL